MPEQLEKRLIHFEKENIATPELDTEAISTKEGRKGDDVSRRTYQCLYDKILYHITLRLQYTHSVNSPPSVEDISSVNTKVSELLPYQSNADIRICSHFRLSNAPGSGPF